MTNLTTIRHITTSAGDSTAVGAAFPTRIRGFNVLNSKENYTRLEKMMITSLDSVIKASNIPLNERVGFIISTTKGNIDALDEKNPFPPEYFQKRNTFYYKWEKYRFN